MAWTDRRYNISFAPIQSPIGAGRALRYTPRTMLQRTTTDIRRARPRALGDWLMLVAAMIVGMVVLGGITRLTQSGLSITEWDPISGIIPPLNHAQWVAEFDHYKRIPEYTEINRNMTLAGFKAIFFWEYLHRLWGRLIGFAFALPLLWFALKRRIPRGYGWRLTGILALGGVQGAIGWWMVSSGLAVRTDVSHIRLAVHLVTALVILSATVWTALDLYALARNPTARPARLRWLAAAAILLLLMQITLGAFTAGLNAGYAFDTWPLMGDRLFPAGVAMLRPAWINVVDNPIVVQFVHRWFAFLAAAGLVWLAFRAMRAGAPGRGWLVIGLVALQIALGVSTLLSGVEIVVAVWHQLNAALTLIAAVAAAHAVGRRRAR
jgi:cytochrome c oxidase assembly protein subunit 15